LNREILNSEVQEYISNHLTADVHKIAMAKSPFQNVSPAELSNQISAKNKSMRKLPSWYGSNFIYYPALLSIEQCSSEVTALYKSTLAVGKRLIDLTGGFGVDAYYFAKRLTSVTHCEINTGLSEIAAYNALVMLRKNIRFLATDGLEYLKSGTEDFDTIYIDPARRNTSGKVFMLKDCTPNVTLNLDLLLSKSQRIIIKTAPLLDITSGLKELKQVSEVHVVSVKNECKELLWIIDHDKPANQTAKIIAVTLNEITKTFSFYRGEEELTVPDEARLAGYLYEPDAALLKSGGFALIAPRYGLQKLHHQTHLYVSMSINTNFPGRIFKIKNVISTSLLKKQKDLKGNVIVRNYPDHAELLIKKYKIKPDNRNFLIFTHSTIEGNVIIDSEIIQHY